MKPIKDIRYYEAAHVPGPGVHFAVGDGTLYSLPRGSVALGQRIAGKLRELDVRVGDFDHLHLAFTPELASHEVVVTNWGAEPWQRYVACGLPPDFNGMADADRLAAIQQRTFAALRRLAPDAEPSFSRTEALLAELGEELPIELLQHSTRLFDIARSYTVAPFGVRPSRGWISVEEKAAGRTTRVPFVDLRFVDDIFFLASRVSVVERHVVIHPRRFERAGREVEGYRTPISVDIDAALAASTTRDD